MSARTRAHGVRFPRADAIDVARFLGELKLGDDPTAGPQLARCLAVLSLAFAGLHNVPHAVELNAWRLRADSYYPTGGLGGELPTAPRAHRVSVYTVAGGGSLATFDGSGLTALVIGAHAWAVRVEISPASPTFLRLGLHARQRGGRIFDRHPTLHSAWASYRDGLDGAAADAAARTGFEPGGWLG